MLTTRRGFIGMLGAVAVKPTYFFAPVGGWTSDVIINPNNLSKPQPINVAGTFYHGRYSSLFISDNPKVEDRLIIYRRSEVLSKPMRELPPHWSHRFMRA
jgi:hypothetical protein